MNTPTAQTVKGHWVGGFELSGRWVFMQAHFLISEGTTRATIDFPLDGEENLMPIHLNIMPARVQFEVQRDSGSLLFEGRLKDGVIVGDAWLGKTQSHFRLVQVTQPKLSIHDDYIGTYRLAPERLVFVGNLLGSTLVAYHDFESADVRAIFPSSESTFFAGPALLIPSPLKVELAFTRDQQGLVTGLIWRQPGQSDVFVPKVKLQQEQVHFANGDVTLAGTLLLPLSAGPHPAVVLIHGSGPQTRHMVRLLGDTFARHGIAALTYDKRGVGESTGDWTASSFDELAEDALAGVRFLRNHRAIKPDQIGLCGGSQAGWIAPMAAARSRDVAFTILIAGPAVSIARQNVQNAEHSLRADGFSEGDIQTAVAHIALWNHVCCTGQGWEQFQRSLEQARQASWSAYAWSLEAPPSADEAIAARAEMERDPVPILQQVTCPVLALFGESDTVVPIAENKDLMEYALRSGGNKDYVIRVLPKANHIFLESATGASKEYARATKWVPEYLQIIMGWTLERVNVAG
jgi:pimeloyl-ACP methyl ester carboxylesterase